MKGRLGGQDFSREYRIELDNGVGAALVPRLWAAEKMRRLLGESADPDEHRGKIVELGLEYGLVTPFTSTLALESEQAYAQQGIRRRRSPLRGVRLTALTPAKEREISPRSRRSRRPSGWGARRAAARRPRPRTWRRRSPSRAREGARIRPSRRWPPPRRRRSRSPPPRRRRRSRKSRPRWPETVPSLTERRRSGATGLGRSRRAAARARAPGTASASAGEQAGPRSPAGGAARRAQPRRRAFAAAPAAPADAVDRLEDHGRSARDHDHPKREAAPLSKASAALGNCSDSARRPSPSGS